MNLTSYEKIRISFITTNNMIIKIHITVYNLVTEKNIIKIENNND